LVRKSTENARGKYATQRLIMGTRENTKEEKSQKMVRRMNRWMDGWKKIVTHNVQTDEDIRDRVLWRALVFGEGNHCSVASRMNE
jgi:hypothetical protein